MPYRMNLALAVALSLVAAGCGSDEPAAPDTAAAEADNSSRTLPIPAPAGTAAPRSAPAGNGALAWTVPAGWIEEQPASSMRYAQYRVPGDAGDGTCAVFYFGPGQGGDPLANARRWAGQFAQPDGSSSVDHMVITELSSSKVPVQIVEVAGTYLGGMTGSSAPADEQPGAMLLGGIAVGPDAPWFFKFTGPEALLRAQRPAFERMMESIDIGN